MNNNQEDLYLLNNDPEKLLSELQGEISIIVQKTLIDPKFFNYQEKEELEQMVRVELWVKFETIKKNYNGQAKLRTYISTVVINICRQIRRKRKNKSEIEFTSIEDSIKKIPTYSINAETKLAFVDEYNRFEKILLMYHCKKAKIELCLKLIYRVAVFLSDFINYCKKLAETFHYEVMERLPQNKSFNEKEIYKIITPYLNKCDKKENSEDAVRRWLKTKISEMIDLLNTGRTKNSYNKEVFQILVEKYYDYKKNEKQFPFSPSK